MARDGLYPVIVVYLNEEERDRLRRAFEAWPKAGSDVLTFRQPHEGQVQFILVDQPESGGNVEGRMVDGKIVEQIEDQTDQGADDCNSTGSG